MSLRCWPSPPLFGQPPLPYINEALPFPQKLGDKSEKELRIRKHRSKRVSRCEISEG